MTVRTEKLKIVQPIVCIYPIDMAYFKRNRLALPNIKSTLFASSDTCGYLIMFTQSPGTFVRRVLYKYFLI